MQKFVYHIPVPFNDQVSAQIIGRKGSYFIQLTEAFNLDFMWHNKITNEFDIYGSVNQIEKAKKHIFKHIIFIIGKIIQTKGIHTLDKTTLQWYFHMQRNYMKY